MLFFRHPTALQESESLCSQASELAERQADVERRQQCLADQAAEVAAQVAALEQQEEEYSKKVSYQKFTFHTYKLNSTKTQKPSNIIGICTIETHVNACFIFG